MVICVAKQTPTERERKHICDFSRGGLNARLRARIQTLLRGHKYAFFLFQWADFDCGTKVLFKIEVIWGADGYPQLILKLYQQLDMQIA